MADEPVSPTRGAPVDLSHHYSRVTKNRVASSIKDFYKYFSIPGIGNLAGGETCLVFTVTSFSYMQAFPTTTTFLSTHWKLQLPFPIASSLPRTFRLILHQLSQNS